jgi:hypothetical protein
MVKKPRSDPPFFPCDGPLMNDCCGCGEDDKLRGRGWIAEYSKYFSDTLAC